MPSFGQKSATNSYPFRDVVFTVYESGFSALAVIKSKCQPRLNLERKMGMAVS